MNIIQLCSRSKARNTLINISATLCFVIILLAKILRELISMTTLEFQLYVHQLLFLHTHCQMWLKIKKTGNIVLFATFQCLC